MCTINGLEVDSFSTVEKWKRANSSLLNDAADIQGAIGGMNADGEYEKAHAALCAQVEASRESFAKLAELDIKVGREHNRLANIENPPPLEARAPSAISNSNGMARAHADCCRTHSESTTPSFFIRPRLSDPNWCAWRHSS